ncbi:MAG: hypothetical protein V2A79_12535 [Planctomycetota bacterium]
MRRPKQLIMLLALSVGGIPLATFATCDRTGQASGTFYVVSSNDDLVQDAIDFVFGDNHDDDDDDD